MAAGAQVAALGLTGWQLTVAQLIAASGFVGLNIGLNFYNAWLLKLHKVTVVVGNATKTEDAVGPTDGNPNFTFPIFYTMFHMIASVIGSSVIMLFIAKPSLGFPSWSQFMKYKWSLIQIALCTSLSIGLNNVSLTLINLFLNQVIKATGPLPTMIFSVAIERRVYGWGTIVSCGLIVAGTILAIPFSSSGNDSQTSIAGVIAVIVSLLAATLKPVLAGVVMKGTPDRPKLDPSALLFYDCALAFWFMLIYWVVSNEREAVADYFGTGNAGYALGLISAGAVAAFLFNLSNYFFVAVTSALTVTVAGNGVKVINIVISAISSHLSAARNWVGVAIVCASILLYAYFGYQEKKHPPKSFSLPFLSSDAPNGKPGEGTPLTKKDPVEDQGSCCIVS